MTLFPFGLQQTLSIGSLSLTLALTDFNVQVDSSGEYQGRAQETLRQAKL